MKPTPSHQEAAKKLAFVKIAQWARERSTWGISMDHIEVEASIMARNLSKPEAI